MANAGWKVFVTVMVVVALATGCSGVKGAGRSIGKVVGVTGREDKAEKPILEDKPVITDRREVPSATREISRAPAREERPAVTRRPQPPKAVTVRARVKTYELVDYQYTVRELVEKVMAALPRVEGYIVEREGETLYLSLGRADGIREGAVLQVVRQGREFRHPLTDEVLGYFEDDLGIVEITEVREDYSTAHVLIGKGEPMAKGDIVRITKGRIQVAALPVLNESESEIDTELLYEELVQDLKGSGRFDLYDKDDLLIWLLESGLTPADVRKGDGFRRLVEQIPSDTYFFLRISPLKEEEVMEGVLMSAETGEAIKQVQSLVKSAVAFAPAVPGPEAPRPVAARPSPPAALPTPQPGAVVFAPPGSVLSSSWTSEDFDFEMVGLDTGDVDGDGVVDVVVAGPTQIRVMRYDSLGKRLVESMRHTERLGSQCIALDVGDVNANGFAEIYVTNVVRRGAASYVLEFDGTQLRKIAENEKRSYRVLHPYDQQPFLVTQAAGVFDPFLGSVKRASWGGDGSIKTESYDLVAKLDRQNEVDVFGFAVGDVDGDGEDDILSFDSEDRLAMFSLDGQRKWRSGERYGGSMGAVDYGSDTEHKLSRGHPREYVITLSVNQRILLCDLDGDGLKEVIVPQNVRYVSLVNIDEITGIKESKIVILGWDGVTMSEKWLTKAVPFFTSDIALSDVDNDGQLELISGVTRFQKLVRGSKESSVIVYELAGGS